MPESQTVTLTRDLLNAGKSKAGGFTRAQLETLGVPWPPPAGWLSDQVGRTIPKETVDRFLSLKR